MKLKVGDFLRYHRFQGITLEKPMWAEVTALQRKGTQGSAIVLLQGSSSYNKPSLIFDVDIRHSDKTSRTDVPKDQAPDEVFVEIARRALLGVTN